MTPKLELLPNAKSKSDKPQMAPRKNNCLIVEGQDDKFSVLGLVRSRFDSWPKDVDDTPVWIEVGGSADEILEPGYLTTHIKRRETQILGVMLDADTKPKSRYGRIRKQCLEQFPALPEENPSRGVIVENEEHKKLGVWIMPDNLSEGSIETFLHTILCPLLEGEPIWVHATRAFSIAIGKGAGCRPCHTEKAHLYTWLAWQDPPGQSPGTALTKKILDPFAKHSDDFIRWFRELYGLI